MIPGSNLLMTALRVIASTPITYYKYDSREINSVGLWETTYSEPVTIYGSMQPVERSLYEQLGLDLSKKYIHMFVPNSVIDINREVSGDYIIFQGEKFQCESSEPWYGIDGWMDVLCVRVPPTV